MKISYSNYSKQLFKVVLSSSLVLAVILGIALMIFGESSMKLDMELDFGTYDGLWLMIGLPLLSVLVFAVLTPVSFFVYRLVDKRH